jgi:hypothetical protein
MAIEKPQYRVVQELQGIEVREYSLYLRTNEILIEVAP